MSAGKPEDQRRLPRDIRIRLADLRRHYEALSLALERTPADRFRDAARTADPDDLTRDVYPIERGFEILSNYVSELAELGLREAGLTSGDRPTNLRLLTRERVISANRQRKLRAALEARNELQHEYPDVRAGVMYEAASGLAAELPGFLHDYVRWLRRLGYGSDG